MPPERVIKGFVYLIIGCCVVLLVIAVLSRVNRAHASDATSTRQSVMIGPFPDGRVVWCRGREEDGHLTISDADAASCRMDTSDVKVDPPINPCGYVDGKEIPCKLLVRGK